MLPLRDCIYPGEAWLGRYVTFQMENGDGIPVNLREMMAFGGIDFFFFNFEHIGRNDQNIPNL